MKIYRLYVNHSNNWYYSWLLSATVFFVPLRSVLIYFGDIFHAGWGRYFSVIAMVLFALLLILPMLKRFSVTSDVVLIFLFLLVSWTMSMIYNTNYISIWVDEAIDIFIKAFPYYFFARNITDYSELKNILYKSATFTVVVMGIMTIVGKMRGDLFQEGLKYSQFYGVIISSAAVLCMLAALDYKKIGYLFLTITSVAMIILFGARMPLACLLIAILIFVVQKNLESNVTWCRMSLRKLLICFFLLITLVGVGIIIVWLKQQEMDGINAGYRIIYQIINGKFTESKGRSDIWAVAKEYILDHPLIGTGIIADRIVIWESMGRVKPVQGYYAHNIFLEIWMQYGLLLGSVILLQILGICLSLIFAEQNKDKRIVAVFAIAETFGILLLSGPVFSSQAFWIMLGMNATFKLTNFKGHFGLRRKNEKSERVII